MQIICTCGAEVGQIIAPPYTVRSVEHLDASEVFLCEAVIVMFDQLNQVIVQIIIPVNLVAASSTGGSEQKNTEEQHCGAHVV